MKRKLLLLAAFVASALGMRAQTDVFKDITSGKITNPSFEAGNATVADSESKDPLTDGWKYSQSNGRAAIYNSESTTNMTYGASSASAGTYYLRIRSAGSNDATGTSTVTQKSAFPLDKGTYRISFDYKAAQPGSTDRTFTVYAKNGSSELASKANAIPKSVSANNNYFSTGGGKDWTTDNLSFTLASTTSVTLEIQCQTKKYSTGHTTLLLDNFKLEWNLTKSLADLLTEANTYYNEHISYSALKTAIDNADAVKTSSDADVLETQYNALSSALALAQAQASWQEVHDVLAGKDLTVLPTAAANAITTELAKAVPTTSVDDVNAAKDALQAFINSYDGIKTAYAKVKALITLATSEKNNSAGDADAKSTLEAAISTATTNIETRTAVDDLVSDYNTLENARQSYVTSGAEPADGHPFDWTFELSNPSFESGTTGWTLSKETTGSWTYEAESYDPAPVDGVRCLNAWGQQINKIEVYQNVTLPMGSYSFKGYLYSTGKKTQHIYAYITSDNSSSNLSSSGAWEQLTANFTQSSSYNTSVKLGIYSQGNNINYDTYGWFRADHFQLFYKGYKPVLKDLIDKATTLSTQNVGDGAFQIPTSAKTTLEAAIATAQGVYDDADAYGTTIQNAIDALNLAITNYKNATLNAPAAGIQYRIKATAGSASWAGKYYTMYYNNAQSQGKHSISANNEAADYLAQAWTFTAVGGTTNGYKLSMIDEAGDVRYICTALTGYGSGNKTQIRTTTDETKALVVKVVATTGTAGRWFLQNTEDDSYIGGQDAGLYSNSQNYDLSIEAASQASVTASAKAGKFGTIIYPFTPDISTGFDDITFYSCAEVNNGALVLVEVDTPVANTPYLIKNAGESNFSNIQLGWGTAADVNKKVGLLTGIYTQQEIPANSYVLQTQGGVQGFYKLGDALDADKSVAYRAYLTSTSLAKAFYLDFDDTTGIDSVNGAIEGLLEGEVYDLSGRLVKNPTRGIYIVNGKKVLIK